MNPAFPIDLRSKVQISKPKSKLTGYRGTVMKIGSGKNPNVQVSIPGRGVLTFRASELTRV